MARHLLEEGVEVHAPLDAVQEAAVEALRPREIQAVGLGVVEEIPLQAPGLAIHLLPFGPGLDPDLEVGGLEGAFQGGEYPQRPAQLPQQEFVRALQTAFQDAIQGLAPGPDLRSSHHEAGIVAGLEQEVHPPVPVLPTFGKPEAEPERLGLVHPDGSHPAFQGREVAGESFRRVFRQSGFINEAVQPGLLGGGPGPRLEGVAPEHPPHGQIREGIQSISHYDGRGGSTVPPFLREPGPA